MINQTDVESNVATYKKDNQHVKGTSRVLVLGKRLYASVSELKCLLDSHGTVQRVDDNDSFWYVFYSKKEEAVSAVVTLNGYLLSDKITTIKVITAFNNRYIKPVSKPTSTDKDLRVRVLDVDQKNASIRYVKGSRVGLVEYMHKHHFEEALKSLSSSNNVVKDNPNLEPFDPPLNCDRDGTSNRSCSRRRSRDRDDRLDSRRGSTSDRDYRISSRKRSRDRDDRFDSRRGSTSDRDYRINSRKRSRDRDYRSDSRRRSTSHRDYRLDSRRSRDRDDRDWSPARYVSSHSRR